MSVIARKTNHLSSDSFHIIIIFSAWGVALAITSCLFLWLGHVLDEWLGTTPKLMFGLFFLAVIGCFIEIYQAALNVINHKP